jgi:kexin
MKLQGLLFAVLASRLVLSLAPAKRYYDTHHYYVIEHNPLVGASLVEIAHALGVEIVEQVGELKNHWLVRTEKEPSDLVARKEPADRILGRFEELRSLAGRDRSLWSRSDESHNARAIVDSVKVLERQILRKRVKRAPPPVRPPSDDDRTVRGVAQRFGIQDPMFPDQWHLVNEKFPEHMMNVTGVWAMGITGKGVISSFIDDGVDYTAEDLKDNFVSTNSSCFNIS